jgi:glutamate/tyrosine decarboxylase-like PLP-dependent enzyme
MLPLRRAAQLAEEHLDGLGERRVDAHVGYEDVLAALDSPLPVEGEDAVAVVENIAAVAGPGTVASPGPRYFGFVTGGALPAALAADWLVSAWDQNAFARVSSPAVAAIEATAERWVLEALGLPHDAAVGFVTGATAGNLVGLAAARHHVLAQEGWDVEADGLTGAPPVRVLVGEEVHASLLKALRIVGLGAGRAVRVAVDRNGALRADALAQTLAGARGPAIVCAQAGNVNTGASDPLRDIVAAVREHGGWVHVDGAFGLWAAASPELRHVVDGAGGADSWAVDAHKWLNVPYDSGLGIVADRDIARAAFGTSASYLPEGAGRDAYEYVPEMSRRARAVPVYAALRSLGRHGLAELVERCCAHARRLAEAMDAFPGATVLNEVVLNQVLVRFDDHDATTEAVIEGVRQEGEAWLGGTVWRGRTAARVSVSNWSTTEQDIDRLAAAFQRSLLAARAAARA